jgi:RHS repeat-associated protein
MSEAESNYEYHYDAAGNLLQSPGLFSTQYNGNRLIEANGNSYMYDAAQRLIEINTDSGRRVFRYDSENRLGKVEDRSRCVFFTYDALDRRLTKAYDGKITQFVWDGERLAAEVDPSGRVRIYLYADGEARSPFLFIDYDEEKTDPTNGQQYFVFSDQLACPIRIENDRGFVVWQARIEPYGFAVVAPSSKLAFYPRWPGHYFDIETGLNYNRHRYYSPELARYIQPDPLDWSAGINVYAYTARPLDQVDLDSLAPCPKKPMGEPLPEDHPMRQRADNLAEQMRRAVNDEGLRGSNTVITAMVVRRRNADGSAGEYDIVAAVNGKGRIPQRVVDMLDEQGIDVVRVPPLNPADGTTTRITSNDTDFRFGRNKQVRDDETGEMTTVREETTHSHAEQRAMRATDCDPTVDNVSYVAPTRPCCEGCSHAIQDRGGTADNVSEHGVGDGTWW